jgi:DNA-binding NarL/FixJ family response regulator
VEIKSIGGMMMIFRNECNCIVDESLLSEVVDLYCKRNNVYCNNEHRIVLHNSYPTIVISRKHLYVHDLLRAYLYPTRKGFVVHHADFNKLNNSVDNLMYITKSRHTKIHSQYNWQQVKEGKKVIKRDGNKRKDIRDDEIKRLKQEGMSVIDIANQIKCHPNTIYNRMQKWSEEIL